MKALSIRQPWAWAILHAGKRIENRDWRGPPTFRGAFLLHASAGCTRAEFEDGVFAIEQARGGPSLPIPPLGTMPRGAIVGRAKLIDCILPGGVYGSHCWPSAKEESHESPWYMGALGLVLADVERLATPIDFKGALGFFEVPDKLLGGLAWERA